VNYTALYPISSFWLIFAAAAAAGLCESNDSEAVTDKGVVSYGQVNSLIT
jgi:hypothetical protein